MWTVAQFVMDLYLFQQIDSMDAYCIGFNVNCVLMFGEPHVQNHTCFV